MDDSTWDVSLYNKRKAIQNKIIALVALEGAKSKSVLLVKEKLKELTSKK